MRESFFSILADIVLALHVGIAAFVIGGLLFVIVGNVRKWPGANAVWFRRAHLGAIALIVTESWLALACPLTTLEMWLRTNAHESVYGGSFIAYWLRGVLYYDLPPWLFTLAYTLFSLLVVAAWLVFPPNFRRRARDEPSQKGYRHV